MSSSLEVLFTPADFSRLAGKDLSGATCVVFDVLRATSTMVTALWNGAEALVPVEEISEALVLRERHPDVLLAGERDGVRIGPELAGGTAFDLGNSPREFSAAAVSGRTIVMSTTNGTKALRSCAKAKSTLAASFLNLQTIADSISRNGPDQLLLICSGTLDQAAYEDVLGAGALCDLIWDKYEKGRIADSAWMARELFAQVRNDLAGAVANSRNGRRLLSHPEFRADVAFCLQRDLFPLIASLGKDGRVRRIDQVPRDHLPPESN
jgi:2-phosphosulfolactate phosphatase